MLQQLSEIDVRDNSRMNVGRAATTALDVPEQLLSALAGAVLFPTDKTDAESEQRASTLLGYLQRWSLKSRQEHAKCFGTVSIQWISRAFAIDKNRGSDIPFAMMWPERRMIVRDPSYRLELFNALNMHSTVNDKTRPTKHNKIYTETGLRHFDVVYFFGRVPEFKNGVRPVYMLMTGLRGCQSDNNEYWQEQLRVAKQHPFYSDLAMFADSFVLTDGDVDDVDAVDRERRRVDKRDRLAVAVMLVSIERYRRLLKSDRFGVDIQVSDVNNACMAAVSKTRVAIEEISKMTEEEKMAVTTDSPQRTELFRLVEASVKKNHLQFMPVDKKRKSGGEGSGPVSKVPRGKRKSGRKLVSAHDRSYVGRRPETPKTPSPAERPRVVDELAGDGEEEVVSSPGISGGDGEINEAVDSRMSDSCNKMNNRKSAGSGDPVDDARPVVAGRTDNEVGGMDGGVSDGEKSTTSGRGEAEADSSGRPVESVGGMDVKGSDDEGVAVEEGEVIWDGGGIDVLDGVWKDEVASGMCRLEKAGGGMVDRVRRWLRGDVTAEAIATVRWSQPGIDFDDMSSIRKFAGVDTRASFAQMFGEYAAIVGLSDSTRLFDTDPGRRGLQTMGDVEDVRVGLFDNRSEVATSVKLLQRTYVGSNRFRGRDVAQGFHQMASSVGLQTSYEPDLTELQTAGYNSGFRICRGPVSLAVADRIADDSGSCLVVFVVDSASLRDIDIAALHGFVDADRMADMESHLTVSARFHVLRGRELMVIPSGWAVATVAITNVALERRHLLGSGNVAAELERLVGRLNTVRQYVVGDEGNVAVRWRSELRELDGFVRWIQVTEYADDAGGPGGTTGFYEGIAEGLKRLADVVVDGGRHSSGYWTAVNSSRVASISSVGSKAGDVVSGPYTEADGVSMANHEKSGFAEGRAAGSSREGFRGSSQGPLSTSSRGNNAGDSHAMPAGKFGRRPNGGEVDVPVGGGRRDGGSVPRGPNRGTGSARAFARHPGYHGGGFRGGAVFPEQRRQPARGGGSFPRDQRPDNNRRGSRGGFGYHQGYPDSDVRAMSSSGSAVFTGGGDGGGMARESPTVPFDNRDAWVDNGQNAIINEQSKGPWYEGVARKDRGGVAKDHSYTGKPLRNRPSRDGLEGGTRNAEVADGVAEYTDGGRGRLNPGYVGNVDRPQQDRANVVQRSPPHLTKFLERRFHEEEERDKIGRRRGPLVPSTPYGDLEDEDGDDIGGDVGGGGTRHFRSVTRIDR